MLPVVTYDSLPQTVRNVVPRNRVNECRRGLRDGVDTVRLLIAYDHRWDTWINYRGEWKFVNTK
jgi:hypothetical protein